jgi:transcription elongation factor Elf1
MSHTRHEQKLPYSQALTQTVEQPEQPRFHCLGCKSKQPIQHATPTTLKNGRAALVGKCARCGVRMVAFPKASIVEQIIGQNYQQELQTHVSGKKL